MSKTRYMSITPHIYIRMLDGETKEQCEDRLVERIDPDGSAVIGWDESKVEINEEGRSIWTTTMNISQVINHTCNAPRVMTLEEVEEALDTVVWVDRPLFDNLSSEYALIDSYSRKLQIVELRYPFCDKDYRERSDYATYGKTWRCWTSRPTDEQRKAVKWE